MVEEIFSSRVSENEMIRSRDFDVQEVELEPMTRLMKTIKNAVNEYKRCENKDIKIGVFEKKRTIGVVV